MTPRVRFLAGVAMLAFIGCVPSASPAGPSLVQATAVVRATPTATPTPTPTATPTSAPTADPAKQYAALAAAVNREWGLIGSPQAADDLSYPRQHEYVAAWFALENEVAAGISSIDWPASTSRERSAFTAAVSKLRTLLQPSADTEGYLALIGYQPLNDQRAAAAAVRVRLGLPPLGPDDLI